MSITYIYGILDLEIGLFIYIGKSNEPCGRFKGHVRHSDNDCVRKFVEEKGIDDFSLIILERTNFFKPKDWIKRERFWISKFRKEGHPLCNKNGGGGGPTAGWHHTKETKDKMSISRKKYLKTHKHSVLDYHHTKEAIQKIRESNVGEKNPCYGKVYTEEGREKLSLAHTKPYPAFYNEITGEYIPKGQNLSRMCREHDLVYANMHFIGVGQTKRTKDGWMLARLPAQLC